MTLAPQGQQPSNASDGDLRGRWYIDQTALAQGCSTVVLQQVKKNFSAQEAFWAATQKLVAQQPMMQSANPEICTEITQVVTALTPMADTLVVIGTGGASLGAQALCAFAPRPVRVRFLENCDSQTVQDVFTQCPPDRTAWAIISRSGETVETLATSLALMAHYEAAGVALKERVVVITSPGTRPLRSLATHYGWQTLDHPPALGGRFSVFSTVGLLPLAFAGIDIARLMQGVSQHWDVALTTRDALLFEASSRFAASIVEQPMHVVMGYSDRLRPYTQWYKQLWAESLGKSGQGPTPITSIGAIDQHSQLQLYLDGAHDKIFTLILPEGLGAPVPLADAPIPEIAYLSQHTMQDIMHASAEATCATLRSKNLPIRVLKAELGVQAIAELMARTMLETLLVAAILGVDPYSQPAVEEGKQRARQALGMK
jgi:glucose-6-phosphate isomerase